MLRARSLVLPSLNFHPSPLKKRLPCSIHVLYVKVFGRKNMTQQLHNNIGFRYPTCSMKGELSHKITLPDIVLAKFRAQSLQTNYTTQKFNHLACFVVIFRMKRLRIPKILSHKKRRYGQSPFWPNNAFKKRDRTLLAVLK